MAHLCVISMRNSKVSNTPVLFDDVTDEEIYKMTRFPRSAVDELYELVKGDLLRPTKRSSAIPGETQLLAALQFFASGSFQWMIGRSCGLSQSSVSLSINAVTNSLVKLAPEYIKFPLDQQSLLDIKLGFHRVAAFPNIVGAIDCTHVAIKSPSVNEEAYINRKGVHTINCQAVCDNNMRLLNLVAKWPGATHDAFIWRNSKLHDLFQQGCIRDGWLIGRLHNKLIIIFYRTMHFSAKRGIGMMIACRVCHSVCPDCS